MKKINLLFILTFSFYLSVAQGTGGFFNQQSSKQKLMLQQVAELEGGLQLVKAGYHISEKGLSKATELKDSTYDLNSNYFNSLLKVTAAIRVNPAVKSITDMSEQIDKLFKTETDLEVQQKIFSLTEINYVRSVYSGMQKKCGEDLQELQLIITPGKLQLTDHERLERLSKMEHDMMEKLSFSRSFITQCRTISIGRISTKTDNQRLKKLYGIN